jgi:hypothetical protein
MNIFLITINNEEILDVAKAKIKSFPKYYFIDDSKCFVACNMDTAKDVFDKIVDDNYEKNIIVFSIGKNAETDYWGFANKELWTWLKSID